MIQPQGMTEFVAGDPLNVPGIRAPHKDPTGGVVPDPGVLVEADPPAVADGNLRVGLDEEGTRDL